MSDRNNASGEGVSPSPRNPGVTPGPRNPNVKPVPEKAKRESPSVSDAAARLRWSVYALLIFLSASVMLGRILAVDSVAGHPRRPFLSANDRSRWCTVRALVEDDMRVPGVPYAIDRVIQQPGWDTIDMVKHDEHLYSSKPPLLPTLMAAVYWPVYRLGGVTLGDHPYEIDRAMLVLLNLVPLLIFFFLLAQLAERFGTTDWGRIFVMAAACFGTLLTTFAVVVNNHVPAAVCAAVAIYATIRIWFDGERRLRYFVIAGLFAALAATDEFPAASLLAAISLVVLVKAWRPALLGFLPAVVVVAGGFFGTNWIAHHTLKPAYLHQGGSGVENWYDYTYQRNGRTVESYWRNPQGVDRGEPSPKIYALNVLVGHHGVFSLTPVWLLSLVGLGLWLYRPADPRLRWAAAAILAISAAVIAFYLMRPQLQRNYGGVACGLRWLFWLAPLWLLAMLPAADWLAARRWTRGLCLVLLAVSALSASYPTWNPWTDPWLMVFSQYIGWGT
ncbi:MAG: hypothetical protein ABFC96_04730 [Thermoguttaceae bacterium]